MAQVGTLSMSVTSDGSHTRFGGQTPDQIVAPDKFLPRDEKRARGSSSRVCSKMVTASRVSFQKVGFEQREGKRAHHSGHLGSAPPKSRGYSGRGCHS
ncbi:hypothetical protein KY290_010952 [Solanum tuberosum]|uniref:Uncharacterized protein n=1 Tax=Solanum tuberosum TaxID=4113 RepID=A0ABQ7VZA3_SOLTU|nr:hypothetical protein KY290_010952 [Solanum tuberosum]